MKCMRCMLLAACLFALTACAATRVDQPQYTQPVRAEQAQPSPEQASDALPSEPGLREEEGTPFPHNEEYTGYDDLQVLGAERPAWGEKRTVWCHWMPEDKELLSARKLELFGLQPLFYADFLTDMTGVLEIAWETLDGDLKILLVREDGAVETVFDSAGKQRRDYVTLCEIPFAAGQQKLRLAGAPCALQNVTFRWEELDTFDLIYLDPDGLTGWME